MTVTSTPIGVLSKQLQALRSTLADCTQFRTWCGASTQAQALARIYYFDVPAPALTADAHAASVWATYRPFAVVDFWPGVANVFEHRATSAGSWDYLQSGTLWLHLEENYDTENDLLHPDEALMQFANSVGKILRRESTDDASFKGLLDLAGGGSDYLAARRHEVSELYRADEDQRTARGDFLAVDLAIEWGMG
jgi:hypothetical protein